MNTVGEKTMMDKPTKQEPMSANTLSAWRDRMGYSPKDACEALGCTMREWNDWEHGRREVPLYIGFACSALALGMPIYK
jgi:DNA-binding transcriptional regulator YiaG